VSHCANFESFFFSPFFSHCSQAALCDFVQGIVV
jgi:hypothetical protein